MRLAVHVAPNFLMKRFLGGVYPSPPYLSIRHRWLLITLPPPPPPPPSPTLPSPLPIRQQGGSAPRVLMGAGARLRPAGPLINPVPSPTSPANTCLPVRARDGRERDPQYLVYSTARELGTCSQFQKIMSLLAYKKSW